MKAIHHGLTKDETFVFRTKSHWAVLLGPALVIILGALAAKSQGIPAFALMAFGLVWCGFSYISLDRSEMGVTERRVLIHTGFPVPKFYDIPFHKIVAIDFYQPALGSMLNFGRIWIIYEGQRRCSMRFVSSPALFVSEVRQRLTIPNGF
jgi:hypothetical protein